MLVVRLAEERSIEIWATMEMLAELKETLHYNRLAPRLRELKLTVGDLIAAVASLVSLTELGEIERVVPEDADDDIFPNCARAVTAEYLISGNKHLLRLKEWAGIPIVAPREFLEREFPSELQVTEPN